MEEIEWAVFGWGGGTTDETREDTGGFEGGRHGTGSHGRVEGVTTGGGFVLRFKVVHANVQAGELAIPKIESVDCEY